jgi:hypothetical protein
MSGYRRLCGGVLLLTLFPVLASCSRDTPLCGYADGLVKGAQVVAAADAYAAAERAGEGDCAEEGLVRVGELRASAETYNARGRAAARAGQTEAAQASFRAALTIDRGDAAATDELQRLARTDPTPAPAVSTVLISGPAGNDAGRGIAWVALVVAVLAAGVGVVLWRLQRRSDLAGRLSRTDRDLSIKIDALSARLNESQSAAGVRADETAKTITDLLHLIRRNPASSGEVDEWYSPRERP